MLSNDKLDRAQFDLYMKRLKQENQELKKILRSKQYRIGKYLYDFCDAFKSTSNMKKYVNDLKGKIRWRRLCKKYPISHETEKMKSKSPDYFSTERIAIYTSIFGSYDIPMEPLFRPDNCDFYIMTDQAIPEDSIWRTKKITDAIEPNFEKLSNIEKNRFCKMVPHVLFKDYKYSIYIDGNVKPISDLTEFINIEMPKGMLFHNHKARDCVYEEIEACKILKKASEESLNEVKNFLRGEGFPEHYGMVECNVIVRDHTNAMVNRLMEEWWSYFKHFSAKRDQLIMPFLLWKYNISVEDVNKLGPNVQENPALRVTTHK